MKNLRAVFVASYEPIRERLESEARAFLAAGFSSKQLAINLNAGGKISDVKLLDEFGYDPAEEKTAITQDRNDANDEAIHTAEKQADAQGRAQVILARYQAKAQRAATDEQFRLKAALFENEIAKENGTNQEDPYILIDKYALELLNLPPIYQQERLMELQKKMPVTFIMVVERMTSYQMEQMQQQAFLQQVATNAAPQQAPNQKPMGKHEGDKIKQTKDDTNKKHGPTRGQV